MARNTLGDLNNHLFEQLERLNDEGVKGEDLQEEVNRANAVANIAKQIVSNANIMLRAKTLQIDFDKSDEDMPTALRG